MNRMPRKGRVPMTRQNDSLNRFKQGKKTKGSNGMQLFHSPLRKPRSKEKRVVNRCCYVSPRKTDFGQYYHCSSPSASKETAHVTQQTDHNQSVTLLPDQYETMNSPIPNIIYVKGLKKVPCDTRNKVKTGSQRFSQNSGNSPKFEFASDGLHWQKVNSVEEADNFITSSESSRIEFLSKHIFISKVPRVKVIAEKFSKYKRGNLELRRLDEKVVCVEYDVLNQSANKEVLKPVQRMRAFFSIKPSLDNDSGQKQGLPTDIKHEFDVLDEDLQKYTEKEIEFIDGKIKENESYLENLRRILKRKHVIHSQKNKTSLDLQSLYEMARKGKRPLNYDFSEANLLSKAELEEVKDLILQRCTSSVHGFSRRTIKKTEDGSVMDPSVISEIIMAEIR